MEKVKMTSVDTGGIDWMSIAMSEYGEDWAAGKDGTPERRTGIREKYAYHAADLAD